MLFLITLDCVLVSLAQMLFCILEGREHMCCCNCILFSHMFLCVLVFQFHSVQELEKLGQMISVTTLALEGNPFTRGGVDIMSLANTLRKIFPNIQTVVSYTLSLPVLFTLEASISHQV